MITIHTVKSYSEEVATNGDPNDLQGANLIEEYIYFPEKRKKKKADIHNGLEYKLIITIRTMNNG